MNTNSWHIPTISTYNIAPPNDILHVIFLQRQSAASRARVLDSLTNVDKDWATQYDAHPRTRTLKAVPWIRDYWPSSETILEIAASAPDYKSFVLIDSGWEDGTVLAAHWADDEHSESHLYAARVQMDVSNVLLTLLDDGKVATLTEVLGEKAYEETKVDFYKDQHQPTGKKRKAQPYEVPSFLPEDLALNQEAVEIVSLRKLSDEQIKNLTQAVQGGTKRSTKVAASTEHVKIHNWKDGCASRLDMRQVYDWMLENTPEEDRHLPAFFVDNILEDEDHNPRVVAVLLDKFPDTRSVRMFPLRTNRVLAYFEKNDNSQANGMIWEQEFLLSADRTITLPDDGNRMGCPVFYLRPFDQDQEQAIRAALNEQCNIEADADWGSEFTYFGYIFPSTSDNTRTLSDLADFFQKCDPRSQTYNPNFSDWRFHGYPSHFVAVDERVLDPNNPRVIMASSLDFMSWPLSNDMLGWQYGTVEAEQAHVYFVNLMIANIGPSEIFDDCKALWLNDLKAHEKEAKERKQAQEEAGEDVVDERDDWVGTDTVT